MREFSLKSSRALAWLLVVMTVAQFYTAGMVLFGAAPTFKAHQVVGTLAALVALLMLIAALVGRAGKSVNWHAAGCFALTFVQPVLVFVVRPRAPFIAALHPVVGLMIGLLAWRVAKGRPKLQ
jgi:hypothetical protein